MSDTKHSNSTDCPVARFPFKSVLSLDGIINHWQQEAKSKNKIRSENAKRLLTKIENIDEFRGKIKDITILEKHTDLVDAIMSALYLPGNDNRIPMASNAPFQFVPFYSTKAFREFFPTPGEFKFKDFGIDESRMITGKMLGAFSIILNKLYNHKLDLDSDMVMRIPDKNTGLDRYYQLQIDKRFIDVEPIGALLQLSHEQITNQLQDSTNISGWLELLPPEKFEFSGFVTLTAIDVTNQEVVSAIKRDLLEKDAIFTKKGFTGLERNIRNLFKLPEIAMELTSQATDHQPHISDLPNARQADSNYQQPMCDSSTIENKMIVIYDLENCTSDFEKYESYRNIIIAPLFYDNDFIGVLELKSKIPGVLNSLNAALLNDVLPLFSIALKRSLEEKENEVQKIIKEEYTAIHSAVEWRFRDAAQNLLHKRKSEPNAVMEPIIFDNVYPLFGVSDIRNSSIYRNQSIQDDLVAHLEKAYQILTKAIQINNIPALDEINFRIAKHISHLKNGLKSGDEVSIIEFLKTEVETVFDHLSKIDNDLQVTIEKYRKSLNPELKTFYDKRKDYEESVAKINSYISQYLDLAQQKAQTVYPHYFEKYKTDGVEHGIYIGQSMAQNMPFDQIYLKNLRLWQLQVMCEIARGTNALKSSLKIELDTTHLILVQDSPLAIRFRPDEKKFDVDGTYNLRYEIMKKRIDKAIIKGKKERLTQPAKIAIVYSQDKEKREYERYIEYLKNNNFVSGKTEELELEELQGVSGLHALRFEVQLKKEAVKTSNALDAVHKILNTQ